MKYVKAPDIQKCTEKMWSGFTHEDNVVKATGSFESETLFTTEQLRRFYDWYVFNYISYESVVNVSVTGWRSSVPCPRLDTDAAACPSTPAAPHRSVWLSWWYIYCLFQFLIHGFFFFFFCSSFLSHLSPWPETDTTTRDRWGQKLSSSVHCGNKVFMSPDQSV